MLSASGDMQTQRTAATMSRHIMRLEQYADTMSSLQKLEETQPEYKNVAFERFALSLHESASLICTRPDKKLVFENQVDALKLSFDTAFFSRIFDNLLSNAVRCASSEISVRFFLSQNGISMGVSDDGPGFSQRALQHADSPYFSEEKTQAGHFGLGLTICKILCEHHHGFLWIENTDTGGCVTAQLGLAKDSGISH